MFYNLLLFLLASIPFCRAWWANHLQSLPQDSNILSLYISYQLLSLILICFSTWTTPLVLGHPTDLSSSKLSSKAHISILARSNLSTLYILFSVTYNIYLKHINEKSLQLTDCLRDGRVHDLLITGLPALSIHINAQCLKHQQEFRSWQLYCTHGIHCTVCKESQ